MTNPHSENKQRLSGVELRKIRACLGFSGPLLADLLGVRDDTLRKWETDRELIPYRVPEELLAVTVRQLEELEDLATDLEARVTRVDKETD